MSDFSQLLSDYIRQKNIRIYSLAEYCGIDRSLMYKIVHGKRVPASSQVVDKIAEYLHLTPGEFQELSIAFAVESQGYDNFYRRKDVLDFLNNFKNTANINKVDTIPPSLTQYDVDLVSLSNETEVNQAVFSIVSKQIQEGNGEINMLLRTDYPFLINLLVSMAHHSENLKINHIICLNNTEQTNDKKNYNLHCLMDILPLCTCGCAYQPYYYYDNAGTRLDALRLFPYLILTDSQAVVLSETLQTGFLTQQKDLLSLLRQTFYQYKAQTRMLLSKIDNVYEQLTYIQNTSILDSSQEYSLQMIPCMTDLLTVEFLEKYVNPAVPSRQTFIQALTEHIRTLHKCYSDRALVIIFSEEGVREFLETGLLEEYPSYIYSPPSLRDRIRLIERFINEYKEMPHRIRMLRHSIGTVKNGVNLYVCSQSGYLLFTPVGYDMPIWLDIRESGLLFTFLDFFKHMDESMFYPHSEAMERMENIILEYSERL